LLLEAEKYQSEEAREVPEGGEEEGNAEDYEVIFDENEKRMLRELPQKECHFPSVSEFLFLLSV